MALLRVSFFFLLLLPLPGAWLTDLEKAQQVAGREQKDIFLVFTSLKISGACVQLEKRVLSQDEFQEALDQHFVLVHLDVPLQPTAGMVSPKAKNRTTAEQFGVESYPASFWLDAKGRTYAGEVGTMPGKAAEVAARVLQKQKAERLRGEELRQAYDETGMARARAIIAVLENEVRGADPARDADHLAELARLDPEDNLAFQGKRKAELAFGKLESSLKKTFQEGAYADAIEQVEAYLAGHHPSRELLQKVLFRKLAALRHSGRVVEARKTAGKVVELDPQSSHGRFAARILEELEAE